MMLHTMISTLTSNLYRSRPKHNNKSRSRKLRLESLENRELFALSSGELRVNTDTLLNQSEVAIASAADGKSVAVWTHQYSSSDTDVRAQRFDSAGNKVGSEISVAASTRDESLPDVAMKSDGSFVVAWVDQVTSTNEEIRAQRFSSSGAKLGSVISVTTSTKNDTTPSIAIATNGTFVIGWMHEFSSSDTDVFARRYSSTGTFLNTIIVSNSSTFEERYPDVAMAPDGRFAVSYSSDSASGDVLVKRYNASAGLVNTHTVAGGSTRQVNPRISMDANANTMVVWNETISGDDDIKARRISNTGVLGSVITVVNTSNFEIAPDVSYKRDGTAFVVTYYNTNAFSTRAVELTNLGVVRSRTTIGTRAALGYRAPVAFGFGSNYRVAYSRTSTALDVFQRKGVLS